MAKKLNRKFCGIELNEEYSMWATQRLINAETDPSIQGYKDGVFWERNTMNLQKKAKKEVLEPKESKQTKGPEQLLLL